MEKSGRNPGKAKKKPDYDKDGVTAELLQAVVEMYGLPDESGKHPSLQWMVEHMTIQGFSSLNPIKIRKLLITAGELSGTRIYDSSMADQVSDLRKEGRTIEEIQEQLGLSRSSVHSYLPYSKVIYKMKESSVGADRERLYRERKKAVAELDENKNCENLWKAIVLFAGYPFTTSKGLKYTYTVKGGEVFFSRKEKSITRATVDIAYRKVLKLQQSVDGVPGKITGPKMLGVFGASYLYPVLVRIGVIVK